MDGRLRFPVGSFLMRSSVLTALAACVISIAVHGAASSQTSVSPSETPRVPPSQAPWSKTGPESDPIERGTECNFGGPPAPENIAPAEPFSATQEIAISLTAPVRPVNYAAFELIPTFRTRHAGQPVSQDVVDNYGEVGDISAKVTDTHDGPRISMVEATSGLLRGEYVIVAVYSIGEKPCETTYRFVVGKVTIESSSAPGARM